MAFRFCLSVSEWHNAGFLQVLVGVCHAFGPLVVGVVVGHAGVCDAYGAQTVGPIWLASENKRFGCWLVHGSKWAFKVDDDGIGAVYLFLYTLKQRTDAFPLYQSSDASVKHHVASQ